ncbi:hypothetical protein ACF07F_20100 [Streptomyces sp. NPDC015237]
MGIQVDVVAARPVDDETERVLGLAVAVGERRMSEARGTARG